MPKRIQPLSETEVKKARAREKEYKLSDGFGLYLLVSPTGGKLWRMQYRFAGKQKLLSFGAYPSVSLADARHKREDARKILASGIDPSAVRKAQKAATISSALNSLEVVARSWHSSKSEGWAESHAATTLARLEKNIFPWLGAMPVSEIKLSDIKSVLHRIEDRAPESAKRMFVALNMIFRYCVASMYIDRNPLEGLKPKDVLRREAVETNLPAIIDPVELGKFLRAIDDLRCTFVVKSAFRLCPLVFVRPGDLRAMEWADVDFGAAEWNIPIEKMKLTAKEKIKRKGQIHCVPLSRQALAILQEIQPLTGRSKYVFPGARSYHKPLSEAAITAAIHRMGYKGEMTWHGFRAVARTLLDEVEGLEFPVDIIEHQLAHSVRDSLGRAYNRTTKLPQRRRMMQAWADYLDGLKAGEQGVP